MGINPIWKNKQKYSLMEIAHIACEKEPRFYNERMEPTVCLMADSLAEHVKRHNLAPLSFNWANAIFDRQTAIEIINGVGAPNFLEGDSSRKDSEINKSERRSMLSLILGMAIDAYGYDPNAEKNDATGGKNGIATKLQDRGFKMTDDTVRKYLKEAKELFYAESQ